MKKNFIKRDDLNQIVGELAERMLDHTSDIRLNITIGKDYKGNDVMTVETSGRDYRHLDTQEYEIIESVTDWMEITEEVIGRAVEIAQEKKKEEEARARAEEKARAEAEQETEETDEEC